MGRGLPLSEEDIKDSRQKNVVIDTDRSSLYFNHYVSSLVYGGINIHYCKGF